MIMNDAVSTIDDFKNIVKEFCEVRDWDQFHTPKDLAISITTEASELLELFRFKDDEQSSQMLNDLRSRQKINEEISDVLSSVLRFAQMYDIDLSSELMKKSEQNEIKYPVEKSKGSNKKYSEL